LHLFCCFQPCCVLVLSTEPVKQNSPDHVMKQWDDWVPQDRVRKFTEENKELAAQLHSQMKALQQKAPKSATKRGGRANGSDFSSARGSEERHVAAQGGRGPRRNRDYDLEPVSACKISLFLDLFFLCSLPSVTPSPRQGLLDCCETTSHRPSRRYFGRQMSFRPVF
jgi:hypothetical protein